ncbi:MAG TPA: serine/threonine-protein kinase [Thermoanaerobaculia bacterium]|nr:serine/threonine-protein kinase [Thermoanaerobaculia bacterium]
MVSGTPADLGPGALLDGKYEILGLLGAGGMGEVYKARHLHLGAFRCIKIVKSSLMADDAYRQRFLREARLATQIHHPNLAVVHDFSILGDGMSYMVTEYIDGTTVRQWETANGRFPLALAVEVALQVLNGLDHIHRRGLLHRDISADNVMLAFDADDHLVVKIIDLGVAKDVSSTANPADTTQAGLFMGNPKYMSPEQLGEMEEHESLDGRTDLYSLGVVLYEMITGAPPFNARTPNGYIVKHLTEPPRAFREVNPGLDLPRGLEAVILRAMEKNRANRYATAREMADAIGAFAVASRRPFSRTDIPIVVDKDAPGATDAAEEAWAATLAADTYSGFRDYRARFPSFHAAEAESAIEERLAFDTANTLDTEQAWREYLERWGHDRHAAAAEERLELVHGRETTAFSVAMEDKSAAAWRAYLDEFPDSERSSDAETHLREALAYEESRAIDTIAAWGLFLLNHPAGLHEHNARLRLEQLGAADEAKWTECARANTVEALQEYMRAHPVGRHVADARRAIARLAIVEGDFNAAWETGTVAAWDHYIATYPDAPRMAEARECRREAEEYGVAAKMNTRVMWRAFVKAWPNGRHRLDAEVRLKD